MRLHQGSFSDDIKQQAITELTNIESELKEIFHDALPVEHTAIATAAFRQAANGQALADALSAQLKMKIDIISAQQEGLLAYYGIKSKCPKADPIVFYLCGGSIQFTYQAGDNHDVIGLPFGVETFTGLLQKEFGVAANESLNPFNDEKVTVAANLADSLLNNYENEFSRLRALIASQNRPVICTGAVHNIAIYQIMQKVLGEKIDYSRANLERVIQALTNKSDADLASIEPNPQYAQIQLPTLILALKTMEALGIEQMQVMNMGNTHALLVKPISAIELSKKGLVAK
jgi:exopolyphosphatase/guanosine-5'-triphosphate,3'-diphosphate pyrophosphatase